MTFMRKFLDLLNMDNWKREEPVFNEGKIELKASEYEDVCQYIKCDKNEHVYETSDHSIVSVSENQGIKTTCITPPPQKYEPQFISEYSREETVKNIFYGSNIPVVNECKTVKRTIRTFITRDYLLNIKISSLDIYTYDIVKSKRADFMALVDRLNAVLSSRKVENIFNIDIKKIKFQKSDTKIRVSSIRYDYEKNTFCYFFTNDVKHDNTSGTEYGEIVVDEQGIIKSAYFIKWIEGIQAKLRFKGYKSGFDLYDIKYNGSIYYKRSQNGK